MAHERTGDKVAEFTFKAVGFGLLFGVMFGAANAYLGLKAGLTVSTSIPIAVLSIAAFRLFRGGTILEANMAQTVGSASSSLASGTIFTIPALFMWGIVPAYTQVALLAGLGGILGILAMVPLRRLLIVKGDAELPYPEGRACAEVLKATESGAQGSGWIFLGLGLGAALKLVMTGLHWLPEKLESGLAFFPGATLALNLSPALLAVGYIVGFRAASVMVAGALLTAIGIRPLITAIHGSDRTAAAAKDVALPDIPMDDTLRYIGAGAIATAGLVTIIRTAPTMVRAFRAVVVGMRQGGTEATGERTDRDVPGWLIGGGLLLVVAVLAIVPGIFAGNLPFGMRAVAAVGVLVFGLVFVPVSSRLVGVIGVSSNPTSAMALITLVGTSLAFLAAGALDARAAVLTVGTVVCIAASKAGDISQDLKTGYLVRATPALQQYGQLIAAAVACWTVALVIFAIDRAEGFTGDHAMPAPQARIMKTVIEAVLGASLPWDLVLTGAAFAATGALAGLPPLPFALGIYLSLSTMAAVFLGGCVRRLVEGRAPKPGEEGRASPAGILCASGFVAGEGLAGVVIAAVALWTGAGRHRAAPPTTAQVLISVALVLFACAVLFRAGRSRPERGNA